MSAPIAVTDDEDKNQIQTTELYTIERAWVSSEKDGAFRCEFYPKTIAGLLQKPVDTRRRLPIGLGFPQYQTLRIEATLPEPWPPDEENKEISDPAFHFRKTCHLIGSKLLIQYEYQSLADSVSAERAAQYLQRLNAAVESLGYGLVWR